MQNSIAIYYYLKYANVGYFTLDEPPSPDEYGANYRGT